jgi:phosphatidylglycerophosphatase A
VRPSLSNPIHLLATGFGTGLAPRAPGTAGTLAAVPLYLALGGLSLPLYLVACAALFAAGVWICGRAAADLGVHDHPGIVFDEMIGYLLTMTAAPSGVAWMVLGFVVFRFFDILKPWPIGALDRQVRGGFGIMLDDLVAAMMALAVLQAGAALWA